MAPLSSTWVGLCAIGTVLFYPLGIQAQCNGDNCARAVTGTGLGEAQVASAKADCSSFLVTTVLADAVTITVTEGPSSSSELSSPKVPAYASPCSGSSRYSSACACWGISGGQITITPTSTIVASTTPEPTTTAVPFEPEVPESYEECAIDPDLSTSFQLADPNTGLPIINNGSLAKVVEDVPEGYAPPTYQMSKPDGVRRELYDVVLEGEQPLYIAIYKSGKVGFVSESSNGQTFVSDGEDSYITTAFIVSCEGRVSAGIFGGEEFSFLVTDDERIVTRTSTGIIRRDERPVAEGFFLIPTQRQTPPNHDRCFWRQYPYSLGITPTANGCGPEGGFRGIDLVPDFNFGQCCNAHDICFGTCSRTFKSCNDAFYSCAMTKCARDYSAFPKSALACATVATFYDAAIAIGGGSAFQAATDKHCGCACEDPGLTSCNGACVNTTMDNMNCGQCNYYICPPNDDIIVFPSVKRNINIYVNRNVNFYVNRNINFYKEIVMLSI